jgi:hypothetical protein
VNGKSDLLLDRGGFTSLEIGDVEIRRAEAAFRNRTFLKVAQLVVQEVWGFSAAFRRSGVYAAKLSKPYLSAVPPFQTVQKAWRLSALKLSPQYSLEILSLCRNFYIRNCLNKYPYKYVSLVLTFLPKLRLIQRLVVHDPIHKNPNAESDCGDNISINASSNPLSLFRILP